MLNTAELEQKPGYSKALEILCSIPCEPAYAAVADLCHDFDVASWHGLRHWFRRIQDDHRVRLVFRTTGGDRSVAVEAESWDEAKAACGEYWRMVHDGGMAAVLRGWMRGRSDAPSS